MIGNLLVIYCLRISPLTITICLLSLHLIFVKLPMAMSLLINLLKMPVYFVVWVVNATADIKLIKSFAILLLDTFHDFFRNGLENVHRIGWGRLIAHWFKILVMCRFDVIGTRSAHDLFKFELLQILWKALEIRCVAFIVVILWDELPEVPLFIWFSRGLILLHRYILVYLRG